MVNNKIEAFHALARKYCIDRLAELNKDKEKKIIEVYKKSHEYKFSSLNELIKKLTFEEAFEELDQLSIDFEKAYPDYAANDRIPIVKAILNEIETIWTSKISSEYQIYQAICTAAHKATTHYANGILESVSREYNDEKELFYEYLDTITGEDLDEFTSLPYRRVLTIEEVMKVKESFKKCWLERIWELNTNNCKDIARVETINFFKKINLSYITGILNIHGINKIFEIDTCNVPPISYVMDVSLLDIQNKIGDVFWCSENMKWGIVRDHEGIIYICSEWLINELKGTCPSLFNFK